MIRAIANHFPAAADTIFRSPEIEIPELDGKTSKMFRGGTSSLRPVCKEDRW